MKKERYILRFSFVLIVILISVITFSCLKEENNNKSILSTDDENAVFKDDNEVNVVEENKKIIDYYKTKYNNDDVVGEFSILNTEYKKALMQNKKNNDYYLNHTENGSSSFMGSIYLDFRVSIDDSNKLLIYGHNSEYVDMPFKILEKYYDYNFYKEHQYIKIITPNKTRLYKIYAVLVETSDFSYMKTDFNDENEWFLHIKSFKDKSMYDTFEEVNESDNILIMQTCSTHSNYKKYDKKFMLVVAKEV